MADPTRFKFTLPATNVLDTIPDTTAGAFTQAEVSPLSVGPVGPAAKVVGNMWIYYGGKLQRGNDFGTCEVTITGSYEVEVEIPPPRVVGGGAPGMVGVALELAKALTILFGGGPPPPKTRKERVSFIGTANLTVKPPNAPTFNPAAVTVSHGRPGPEVAVEVQVTPPGPYEIVMRVPPNSFISALPTVVTTDKTGKGTVMVRDLMGEFPRGPITVTGTISPQSPFTGTDVEGSFTVAVGP